MNINTKLFISILIITLSFPLIESQNITITTPKKSTPIYANQVNELQILVKNNMDKKDTFTFSVWPTYWITLEKYWTSFEAGEVKKVSLVVEPPIDAKKGTHVFTFSVRSLDSNISESKDIYIDVLRGTDVYLSDEIDLNKQKLKLGDSLLINPTLINVNKEEEIEVFLRIKILKEDLLIHKFDETVTLEPKETKTLSYEFDVKRDNSPGYYSIIVDLLDEKKKKLDEKTTTFNIEAVRELDKQKETSHSILYSIVTIKLTNNGNIRERNLYISESMPLISKYFFYPEKEPYSEEEKDNRIVYKWFIDELNPDETITIRYQLRFINVVFITCLLIIAMVWIIWLFYRPSLKKRYIGLLKGKREITISLLVKNKKRKALKNVEVKDFVPSVAKVIKKFETMKPKIKKKPDGTELRWEIKKLKPKEERVLTYKIKPVIEIMGEIKLPKAHLHYKTKKGKRKRIISKTVTITGKVK